MNVGDQLLTVNGEELTKLSPKECECTHGQWRCVYFGTQGSMRACTHVSTTCDGLAYL